MGHVSAAHNPLQDVQVLNLRLLLWVYCQTTNIFQGGPPLDPPVSKVKVRAVHFVQQPGTYW